jgi:hopanoid biosynthesis associated radical SAM protein HpnH
VRRDRLSWSAKIEEKILGVPAIQKARLGVYIFRQILSGNRRFPLVLMLEPLFQCNLRCKGCGKIAHPPEIMRRRMTVEECVAAVEECGAPIVSIPGGEPLMHPEIHLIARELMARKRFVYLCTNALLVEKRIDDFAPSPYLTFNVHLDGFGDKHDALVCREGVFDSAVAAIRLLVARGFRVTTNTTFFGDETPESAARLFDFLTGLGVEGMTVAPAFNYEAAEEQDNFLGREGTYSLFRQLFAMSKGRGWRFNHSSLYLDFLSGNQRYACAPWGNPTVNIFGWQRPCYLLNDGYAASYRELMEGTDWTRYGTGADPRCADCMVHCGFEPTAVVDTALHPLKALAVFLRRLTAAGD